MSELKKMKKFLKLKKKNIHLFPSTYKEILLSNGFSLIKKENKPFNKLKFNYKIKIPKHKKKKEKIQEINQNNNLRSQNILPKIENTDYILPKIMKHNNSASPGNNNVFDSFDDIKINNDQLKIDSLKKNLSKDNLEIINNRYNNSNNVRKIYLNRRAPYIIRTDNNYNNYSKYDNNNSMEKEKKEIKSKNDKDKLYLKTDLSDLNVKIPEKNDTNNLRLKLFNNNNKNNSNLRLKIDSFLGNHSVKKNNSLYFQYRAPSKLKNFYNNNRNKNNNDNNNNNTYYEELYLNSQKKDYLNIKSKKDKPVIVDNISTKAVKGYTREMKREHNMKKFKYYSPEVSHFLNILHIQQKKQ